VVRPRCCGRKRLQTSTLYVTERVRHMATRLSARVAQGGHAPLHTRNPLGLRRRHSSCPCGTERRLGVLCGEPGLNGRAILAPAKVRCLRVSAFLRFPQASPPPHAGDLLFVPASLRASVPSSAVAPSFLLFVFCFLLWPPQAACSLPPPPVANVTTPLTPSHDPNPPASHPHFVPSSLCPFVPAFFSLFARASALQTPTFQQLVTKFRASPATQANWATHFLPHGDA